ncbi:DUF1624 domain-containing protein [Bartonella tamiae]|uniref:Heparan-alpha-glucosaminide N-acetyltransferase catalytic domain-containing protein n=1 Tax=Bartonella tamiae Th239 TaxID=1094558 RepID=J1JVN3_9HYPH|nr:heparan-alpha-glucosaminide N-acetyltransferase [Bartonella tamiae]EJF88615.1 hypothetical protein ME5_01166 [Bartonella tamiae Th239]EJF95135.1 hypothetical protein MEG_00716 [Bartonella tamiae Th307]
MDQSQNITKRLKKLDIFRGIALIGMMIYHLSWDLSYFSYIAQTIPNEGGFHYLARLVAFSFLFITGFSLYLAHSNYIRWKLFIKRLLRVLFAAVLVSFVTYIIMPNGFIYFGILHQIVLTSIIGVIFLRFPIIINIIVIIAVCLIAVYAKSDIFNWFGLYWLGLSTNPRPSFDYVPFFPWFCAGLAGLTIAQLCARFKILSFFQSGIKPNWLSYILEKLGQHTLFIYLVHQPFLMGILFLISLIFPPSQHVIGKITYQQCVQECAHQADKKLCASYCSCVVDRLTMHKLLFPLAKGELQQTDKRLINTVNICWDKMIPTSQSK